MSWSVTLVGTPEGVAKELDAQALTLNGQSKEEFLEARPYLQGLVRLSVGPGLIKLLASGHASFTNGMKTVGNISVSLETFYGKFCQ